MSSVTELKSIIEKIANDKGAAAPIPSDIASSMVVWGKAVQGTMHESRLGELVKGLNYYLSMINREELKFYSPHISWFSQTNGAINEISGVNSDDPKLNEKQIDLCTRGLLWPVLNKQMTMESLASYGIAILIAPDFRKHSYEILVEDMKGRVHLMARGQLESQFKGADLTARTTARTQVSKPLKDGTFHTPLTGEAREKLKSVMDNAILTLPLPYELFNTSNPQYEAHRKLYYAASGEIKSEAMGDRALPVPTRFPSRSVAAQFNKLDSNIIGYMYNATRMGPTLKTMQRESMEILSGEHAVKTPAALMMAVGEKLAVRSMHPSALDNTFPVVTNDASSLQQRANHLVASVLRNGAMLDAKMDPQSKHHKFPWKMDSDTPRKTRSSKNGSARKGRRDNKTREEQSAPAQAVNDQKKNTAASNNADLPVSAVTGASSVSQRITAVFQDYHATLSVEQLAKKILEAACPDEILPMNSDDISAVHRNVSNMKTHPSLASHSVGWLAEFVHEKRAQKPAVSQSYEEHSTPNETVEHEYRRSVSRP